MFADTKAFSSFAVDDLDRARQFYAETLGLNVSVDEEMGGFLTLHLAGERDVLVYGKPDHSPAGFTVLNFPVGDIDAAADALIERGIRFERYETFSEAADERGVHRANEGPPIAWFTDPAGNVLSVMQLD